VVSVGHFVAGLPGAAAGGLACITPAFLIIPMLRYLGRRAERPSVKRAIEAVMLAAAALIVHATVPLARETLTSWGNAVIGLGSFAMLAFSRIDPLWVIVGAAVAGVVLNT
jgi:chromate transporter